MHRFIILALLFINSLSAAETVSLKQLMAMSERELTATYQGKEVELKGFLYAAAGERHFLAAEPDLKSCCLKPHGQKAIEVEGLGLSSHEGSLVALRGILYVDQNPPHSLHLLAALPADDGDGKIVIFALLLTGISLAGYLVYRVWTSRILKKG